MKIQQIISYLLFRLYVPEGKRAVTVHAARASHTHSVHRPACASDAPGTPRAAATAVSCAVSRA